MSAGRGANPALMDRRRFVGLAATAGAAAMAGALLGGCAGEEERAPEGAATPGQEPAATAAPSPAAPETRATLVAVFSRTGHTLQVAERIHELVESDFLRIEPAAAYPEDYDEMLETAQREQDDDARPALASAVENWDDYDTVYLGHPIWWAHVPQIMKSFVEQHDLAGKTVVPFATSGGSSIAGALPDLEALCPGATFGEGLTLDGDAVDAQLDRVDAWLGNANLR